MQINGTRAQAIRDRMLSNATTIRAAAAEAITDGRHVDGDALARLAESQERMATKRYEEMTIRAI